MYVTRPKFIKCDSQITPTSFIGGWMKIEIEITEEEIKNAIERKVRVAIADQTNVWGFDDYVKGEVKKAIPLAVDKLISECLSNHDGIKNKVIEKIEKAMTAKVQAALKMKA
jgi:hypothetical protein